MNKYHSAVLKAMRKYYSEFDFAPVQDGSHPETWEDLQAAGFAFMQYGTPVPINAVSDANNLYGCWGGNVLFRAWHDAVHLHLGADFSKSGEYAVAGVQLAQLLAIGTEPSIALGIYNDVVAQVEYWYMHREFVQDQLEFMRRVSEHGIRDAVLMGLI